MQFSFPAFALFLFSPILALTYALVQLRDLMSRNLIWLFCGFYGMAFYLDSTGGVDCARYADQLVAMHKNVMSLETFSSAFFQEGERNYDVYQPLIVFFVSRFTDDHRILFGLYGLVIGFFFSRILGFFVDQCHRPLRAVEYGLLACIAFSLDIGSAINGVRMWTALFVFLYGFLFFWQQRNPNYLAVACLSVLVHFSFIVPVALLLAQPVLARFPWLIFAGFVGSFVFAAIDIAVIRNIVEQLPLGIESRVAGYLAGTDPDAATPRILLIIDWLTKMFRIFACAYLLSVNRQGRYGQPFLIVFAMALNAAVNVLGEIGSIGRFISACQILILGQLLIFVNQTDNLNSRLNVALIASLTTLGSLLGLRYFLGFASSNLLLANPFTIWFFEDPKFSLYEFMPKILTGL